MSQLRRWQQRDLVDRDDDDDACLRLDRARFAVPGTLRGVPLTQQPLLLLLLVVSILPWRNWIVPFPRTHALVPTETHKQEKSSPG